MKEVKINYAVKLVYISSYLGEANYNKRRFKYLSANSSCIDQVQCIELGFECFKLTFE